MTVFVNERHVLVRITEPAEFAWGGDCLWHGYEQQYTIGAMRAEQQIDFSQRN